MLVSKHPVLQGILLWKGDADFEIIIWGLFPVLTRGLTYISGIDWHHTALIYTCVKPLCQRGFVL